MPDDWTWTPDETGLTDDVEPELELDLDPAVARGGGRGEEDAGTKPDAATRRQDLDRF